MSTYESDAELAKKLQAQFNAEAGAMPNPNILPYPNPHPLPPHHHQPNPFQTCIQKVCSMVGDADARRLADKYGLNVLNVTWEDNARTKNSSWGPCISDMTLQVENRQLPVIRTPNYQDLTWDVEIEKIPLVVGNASNEMMRTVTLKEFLNNFNDYLHTPVAGVNSLLADRDSHVLMSAQACFLPIPAQGEAKFNVALYNYQSSVGHPAVLAIVASSAGTSAQIIECNHGAQKLYFNKDGQKCSFVAQRLADVREAKGESKNGPMNEQEKQQNMILVIQVPLIVSRPARHLDYFDDEMAMPKPFLAGMAMPCSAPPPMQRMKKREVSDVDHAIVKIGDAEGPFTELNGLAIKRDPSFPVRVTLQYYKATSNGVVNEQDIKAVSEQIKDARKHASFLGSLVVGGSSNRPTEPKLPAQPVHPAPWWDEFWAIYQHMFPQWTKQQAAEHVFQGGRFANTGMGEAADRVIDLLSADKPKPAPPVEWKVL